METTEETSLELRATTCEQSTLTRSDGSALLTQGNTSVMAAVYGPTEVRPNKELIDKASVEVVYKPSVGLPGCAERLRECILRNTCETVILAGLHPRTSISIVLQILEDHGSLLACCINAATLALLDAAVSVSKLIAAIACIIDQDGRLHLDPTLDVESNAVASMTFVFDSVDFDVVSVHTDGCFTNEQFQSCLTACKEASKTVFQFFRDSVTKKLSVV
ncbi:exosome complex component RRP46-like [Tubulanus polymorphus]|uniref:exosome complex component RRP46-like n=1 Tax=Tubulanus polymorphus TaxID=672921 RepID=UPI003DA3DEBA